jgi:HEAT repeat protein
MMQPPNQDPLAAYNPYGEGDGNFKKGRTKPIALVVGMVAVIGGAVAIFLGVQTDVEKMTPKQVADEKKMLQLLPKAEQMPKWRAWAKRTDVPRLQEEAFAQLAWAGDPEGIPLIIKGLSQNDHRIRGTAAQALLEYGSPAADSAKPALLKALAEADNSDKPQIAWALATLHESQAFEEVLKEYRAAHLAKVQRLDGNPAFDPEVLASMVPLDKLATLAGDPSESVRQLVATVLSRSADPKYTGALIKLVQDSSVEVGREAAVGLGKIANEEAMGPLLNALSKADKDNRQKFLEALRDGVGSRGLTLAIKSVAKDPAKREFFQLKQLFDMMHELEDPRAGDLLVAYINTNPKWHWKTEAALRLAEVGDLRAVPTLAARMREDPVKLYKTSPIDEEAMLHRDDNERVVASRMLADLAVLYPDKRDELLAQAEDAVLFWATDKPQPHANALRFLAAVNSPKALPHMRKWAFPVQALPKEGAQPPLPDAWATAQSALRYLGWTKDAESWSGLERQLTRRPDKTDVTMEAMLQGGVSMLGMTLRALGVGAAHGFAQWGDPKITPQLIKYIEDKENNEQSRLEACFALGWVATDDQMKDVVGKVKSFSKPNPKDAMIRTCYLESLIRKPVPAATTQLMDLIKADVDLEVRHQAARAIGFGGVTPAMATQLMEKLKDPGVRSDAALALIIGADADTARRTLATFNGLESGSMEELKVIYTQTFGYWSDRNYNSGDVARWMENAEACARVRVGDALQDWPRLILSRALQGIEFDSGPHSITRVQFRVRLMNDARGADAKKREQAIAILKFMREKGVLMALKGEKGPHAEPARQAFFEVMNPKVVTEAIPDAKTGGGASLVAPK